jgi:DNA-binding beta-propeller fold protein YncE
VFSLKGTHPETGGRRGRKPRLPEQGGPIQSSRLGRRSLLGGALSALALASAPACAPPAGPSVGASNAHVFVGLVGLGRRREVAILDAVTDRVVDHISLKPLGERGFPWHLSVDPSGNAAVLPLSYGPRVGLLKPTPRSAAPSLPLPGSSGLSTTSVTATPATHGRQALWLDLASKISKDVVNASSARPLPSWVAKGTEDKAAHPSVLFDLSDLPEAYKAEMLTTDAQGHLYVVLSDTFGRVPTYVAVIDQTGGTVLRYLKVAGAQDRVLAIQAHPDGGSLYVSLWRWPRSPYGFSEESGQTPGLLVAIDTHTGSVQSTANLPDHSAAVDITLSGPPPGTRLFTDPGAHAIYAITSTPGPRHIDPYDLSLQADPRYSLIAYGDRPLEAISIWALDRRPAAFTVIAGGKRAYLLSGSSSWLPWSKTLTSFNLAAGAADQEWPMPPSCMALSHSHIGKLYVTDTLGDQLWRVNTTTNTLLSSLPMAGAPITVAARPV